jgi:hypothetical protein
MESVGGVETRVDRTPCGGVADGYLGVDSDNRKGLLLGYQEGTHNYRIWDASKVIITRDVIFINTGEDFVKSGDGTFSDPIELKLGWKMRDMGN